MRVPSSQPRDLPPGFERVRWYSHALRKPVSFLVWAPPGHYSEPARRYPALYLLHGSGHDPDSVLREVKPQDGIASLGQSLLVIPAGGQGWWLDSPNVAGSRYGQYLLELVALVDHRYRSVPNRRGRGLCGFSMGGYGAMLMACRHPQMIGSASSLLGPLDIEQMFPSYERLRLLLGADRSVWRQHNPTPLAHTLNNTGLCFCTAMNAFDRPQNDAFAAALERAGILFEYSTHPGDHDSAFVARHISAHMGFHRRAFDRGMQS